MIETRNIHYRAGGKKILQNISFRADPGELTVLLGANGAGKSTLLRLLAGELQPESGTIALNGRPLSAYTPARLAQARAVLTQHFTVALPFNCEEIVMMGRYPFFRNSPAAADKAIVTRCMTEMQVLDFRARLFNTLSGGEQQRVQLARVLAQLQEPNGVAQKLLLLDEPTASMDWLHQQVCLQKARETAHQGNTVIVVLHDLNLAARFADKIILLNKGMLAGQGSAQDTLQPRKIEKVYGIAVEVMQHPDYGFPIIIPTPVSGSMTLNFS